MQSSLHLKNNMCFGCANWHLTGLCRRYDDLLQQHSTFAGLGRPPEYDGDKYSEVD
jgi:hypothetical protein